MIHKVVFTQNQRGRRQGVAMVYFALSLTVIIGMVGFVTDMGRLYIAGAQAQKAADAAALAGAADILSDPSGVASKNDAELVAKFNGFDVTNTPEQVTVTSQLNADGNPNWHRATVSKRVPLYFMPILGLRYNTVHARATAQLLSYQSIPTKATDQYGKDSVGNVNLSMFGPYGRYSFGDAYSPKYLDDGTNNPRYTGKGYDFDVTLSSSYTSGSVKIQIFDPDCYNNGGTDADGTNRIDEIRDPPDAVKSKPGYSTNLTTTKYTLYTVNANGTTGRAIASATYGGTDGSTDMKWVTPTGFEITDLNSGGYATNGSGNRVFRVNAVTIDGSSENGFDIRAGVQNGSSFDVDGTSVGAVGRLPINFNASGAVSMPLANIPPPPSGYNDPHVLISKFDTDIDSKSVNYSLNPPPTSDPNYISGSGYAGQLSSNGEWLTDTIKVPSGYQQADWTANYQAGQQDTSVWEVKTDYPNTSSTSINLVQ
jgi:Flp pilus assembly protein TadG